MHPIGIFKTLLIFIFVYPICSAEVEPSLSDAKMAIIQQMEIALNNHTLDESLYRQVNTLLTEPGSVLGAMGDGALITALGASILAACGAEKLCGDGAHSNLGSSIVTNIFAAGAAIGALPLNLLTIPFAPIGALVGGFFGVKEKRKVNQEAEVKSKTAWSYVRFVYALLLENQQQFMDNSLEVRLVSLNNLKQNLGQNSVYKMTNLTARDFINYTGSREDQLRAEIITTVLNTDTFMKAEDVPLTQNEISTFIRKLTKGTPDHFSKNQRDESAILTIRFVYHLLKSQYIHGKTGDIIPQMLVRGE